MTFTLVCDEQRLFAEALAAALQRDSPDAVDLVAQPEQAVLAASVMRLATLVMSLRSTPLPGLDAICHVRRDQPQCRIVCLTASRDDLLERQAIEAGADQIVVRAGPLADLVAAVHASVPQWVPDASPTAATSPNRVSRRVGDGLHLRFLTARERQAFDLLVEARSTESIVQEMHITTSTARSYVQSVLEKLGVHSRVEAVAYAAQHSLVLPDASRCS
ncbi:MAG: two component transcriptional regulator, LuxR family [Frankiales bacterium]|nr:two component transcriptional regulator, LuxR family [Frankiales bacterium]